MANVGLYVQRRDENRVQESQEDASYADTYVADEPSGNINISEREDRSCHFQAGGNRVQEIQYEHHYARIQDTEVRYEDVQQIERGRQPAATANNKKQSKSSIITFVLAASLLVLFGLALGGILLVVQGKQRLEEANKMYAALATEMREKNQELNETIQEKLSAMKANIKGFCKMSYAEKCYWAIKSKAITFENAKSQCHSVGAEAANVYSNEHYQKIVAYLRKKMPPLQTVWLGMTRNVKTGITYFRNEGVLNYSLTGYWYPGHPDTYHPNLTQIGYHVEEKLSDEKQGFFKDNPNNKRHGILCEL